ncbi:Sensor histidine kinase regulating citrate/malate metabolism [Sinosporangium album]|uniref:histidine kinase n=1 Tax=Sinosporangium album TaxID=504805 RepID=A0A1G8LJ89_9ACTN|nr:Sensor histidine kinase regulating citrate/malate metabolism [Sinosporangium album]
MLQLAVVVVVLIAVGAVSLAQSASTFDRVEGRRLTALAEQMAWSPLVRSQLDRPAPAEVLAPLVQRTMTETNVSSVTIADARGKILSASNPTLIGTPLPVTGSAVFDARGWSGYLLVDDSRELVAQTPVLGDAPRNHGEHLGTVMIGIASPSLVQSLIGASSYLLVYLGLASALGVVGSWLLARRIKRKTLGMEPHEIAGLAEHREAMLYGIAEGVVALDLQLRITLVNAVGRELLDLPDACVGKSLSELGIGDRLFDVLAGPGADEDEEASVSRSGENPKATDEIVVHHGRVLVMNRMNVIKDGRRLGSVTTLRDRTELARLERELGSFRSTTDLLRAQAHEFSNQLHIISGLIQIGEHDEVVSYIRTLRSHRESLDLEVTNRVRDTAVAALLMAKSSLAAERKVRLRLSERTALERLAPEDSADVATVVGNLVDNAVDAAAVPGATQGTDAAWVEVEMRQDASIVEIVVRDSGPGVAPELAEEVFTRGFTTKAAQGGERGIGLALTQLVCRRRGGEVAVANTADGAVFTARLSVGHRARHVMENIR